MINELYDLAKTLNDKGIQVSNWYREYKELPKVTKRNICVRIWLDDDSSVRNFESLQNEQASVLRKYGNNQGSFPAFNISSLYRITDNYFINKLEQIKSRKAVPDIREIESWCCENNWMKGLPKKVHRSLTECSKELSDKIGDNCGIISKLAELCQELEKTDGGFRDSLEKCIFTKLSNGEDIDLCLKLLFYKGSKEKDPIQDIGPNISVILDIYNWSAYGHPVLSEAITKKINSLLLASKPLAAEEEKTETDAFGMSFKKCQEPMPGVKLSGFEVTLRSMFRGQPCQYRYKKIDDDSYPLSPENRSLIKSALEWISAEDRLQNTWGKIDKDEILFVYPSKLPEIPLKFAALFLSGSEEKTSPFAENRFEAMAKEFTETLSGLPVSIRTEMIQIFTLRKMDKARSKVLFTHNTTPESLSEAVCGWSAGCHNLPKLEVGEIIVPFPLKVADIMNAVWKRNGERADGKTPVKRMKYYQGMELLLDILPVGTLINFLRIALENSSGLVNCLGYSIHGKRNSGNEKSTGQMREKAAQIFPVLGLLLYKLDQRKENYMEGLAYLLGQLLNVSDELHIMYYMVKRDGEVPPQLAGSALFAAAGEMPYQALSQLSARMNPYISWAKQYRYLNVNDEGKESWRADWLLGLFTMLSDKINSQMDKSVRFGDFERAKLFIGYMASLGQKETANDRNEIARGNEDAK